MNTKDEFNSIDSKLSQALGIPPDLLRCANITYTETISVSPDDIGVLRDVMAKLWPSDCRPPLAASNEP